MRLAAYTAPAYDLIEPAERARLTSADPRSIAHLTLPTFGAEDAAARLATWRADGTFTVESAAALYVYDLAGPGPEPSTRGWVGAVALAPPTVVAPHEATVAAVVADRRALRAATHADLEPMVFAHGGPPGPAAALAAQIVAARPPDADLTDDVGVRHRLWRVADPAELATVRADLARRHAVIADGHHRWAAATRPPDSGHPGDSPAAARQAAVRGAAVTPARATTAGGAVGRPGSGSTSRTRPASRSAWSASETVGFEIPARREISAREIGAPTRIVSSTSRSLIRFNSPGTAFVFMARTLTNNRGFS